MTCKHCVMPNCDVLIVGLRDLCTTHFGKLPESDRKRLDDLQVEDCATYEAVLAAAVEKLERKPTTPSAWGYPSGPVPA